MFMRSGLLVRGVALAVVVCVVACCSSLSTVVAFNDSTRPIELTVRAPHGTGWTGRLEPGKSVEVWKGFRGPVTMTFKVDGRTIMYDEKSLGGFARSGSAGAEVNWRWRGRTGVFEVATRNKVSKWINQMLALGCVGMLVVGAIAWYVRRLWIQGSPEAQRRNLR